MLRSTLSRVEGSLLGSQEAPEGADSDEDGTAVESNKRNASWAGFYSRARFPHLPAMAFAICSP